MIDKLVRMTKIGFSNGRVTSRNTAHGLAPSIAAASSSSWGTCASPAYTVIVTKGMAPQTISAVKMPNPVHGFANQS